MPTPLLHTVKLTIGTLLIFVAGLAMVGWMTEVYWLASWVSNDPDHAMTIPASVCFLLCGLFILIQATHWKKVR